MGFYNVKELKEMNFKYLGKNVKISRKASIYNTNQISIDDDSRIDDFCVVSGKVTIGKNVHIAVFCNLAGGEKGIFLEDFSGLAYGVHVFSQSDDYSGKSLTNPTIPDQFKNVLKNHVIIKKHVIVGAGSMVFPGVIIEEGCSIGAMTLVTRSTEPWKIYSGIPAKIVKERSKDILNIEKDFLKYKEKLTIKEHEDDTV